MCNKADIYCNDRGGFKSILNFLNGSCPILEEDKNKFDFGIFLDALQSGVVESRDFTDKLFYCFWWGLKNLRYASFILFSILYNFTISHCLIFCNCLFILFWEFGCLYCSSLGQNLATSTDFWEINFAVFISIAGLVLFSFLIGNMQVCRHVIRSFTINILLGFDWLYLICFGTDIFAVNNDKIGGNESKEEGCRTVDVSSVASWQPERAN
jgi:hypothetical protein